MLKNKRLLKVFTVLAVLVMSIFMLTGCGNSEDNKKEKNKETVAYEEPVKNFVEGLAECNSEKFAKAFPDFLSQIIKEVFTVEMLETRMEEMEEAYGANIKMSFKVTSKEEISKDELEQEQENIKTNYGKDVTISKGYELNVEITTKGDDSEDTESDTINVYEVDGKWCIVDVL